MAEAGEGGGGSGAQGSAPRTSGRAAGWPRDRPVARAVHFPSPNALGLCARAKLEIDTHAASRVFVFVFWGPVLLNATVATHPLLNTLEEDDGKDNKNSRRRVNVRKIGQKVTSYLARHEARVDPAGFHQLVVGPLFNESPLVHHGDVVRVHNGREPGL